MWTTLYLSLCHEINCLPSIAGCVEFIKRQAASLDLPVDVVYPVNNANPVVIVKWLGSQPDLPSIMLNSHMDVVPVFPEHWTHGPFSADLDDEGRIFARGTQDTKGIGTQYLGAIRVLKAKGYQPKRTIYVTFVPDEELGGFLGMQGFVKGSRFKELNVGFSLDEGCSNLSDSYFIFYAERTTWQIRFKASGTTGHGSQLLPNTAAEKLHYVVTKLLEFRTTQVKRLKDDTNLLPGDVTAVNLTILSGGVQNNVLPPLLEAVFDIRIAIDVDLVAFEKQIRDWCTQAGSGIEFEFERKDESSPATKMDASNPFWTAFENSLTEQNLKYTPIVCPGCTDSRFLRPLGVSALGFSPMKNMPTLPHAHDEFTRADIYLHGIEVYTKIIPAIASV
ncbi:aminoacylase-1-like [Drosophila hydei]|uniref:N-acyl-aliphatic-L-amino acid amidohydrolase n=1 Tax=Drosophila hydei TaxID=7224 RepID=A0A6J1LVC1_DROHY|nr:aminoacylase-1-like [Drosophila hydei]